MPYGVILIYKGLALQLGASSPFSGTYLWQGSCGAISCGAPPKLPHATPRMSAAWRWFFHGFPSFSCQNGTFSWLLSPFSGQFRDAKDIKRQNWTFGVVIHYDCDKPGYWGSLSARCNVTGSPILSRSISAFDGFWMFFSMFKVILKGF